MKGGRGKEWRRKEGDKRWGSKGGRVGRMEGRGREEGKRWGSWGGGEKGGKREQ